MLDNEVNRPELVFAADDVLMLSELGAILGIFVDATEILSGESYVTSAVVWPTIVDILHQLSQRQLSFDDKVIDLSARALNLAEELILQITKRYYTMIRVF